MTELEENDFLDEISGLIDKYLDETNREVHLAELLSEHLRLRPRNWARFVRLGMASESLFRVDEAIEAMKSALKVSSKKNQWRIYSFLGNAYRDYRSVKEADKWFGLIEEGNVESSDGFSMGEIWIFKGAVLAMLGKLEEALNCYDNALKGTWPSVLKEEAWLNKGYAYRAQGEYKKAELAFNEALKIDQKYGHAKVALKKMSGIDKVLRMCAKFKETKVLTEMQQGELYEAIKDRYHKGKWTHVIELIQVYLKSNSNETGLWRWYGESLMNVGRSREAIKALNKALKLGQRSKENKALVYFFLGRLHEEFSSRKTSEKWYKKAVEECRKINGRIWNERGMNLLILGESHLAMQLFKKVSISRAHKLQKEDAYYNQGLVYRCWGDYGSAKKCFDKALIMNRDNKEAKKALKGLEGIEDTLKLCEKMKTMEV